jgi:FixJ family two-component response regulator
MAKIPCTIAVVDDEEAVRRALLRLLLASGLKARTYESAEDFLANWRNDPPGCVVLDLHMPGLNGLELMQCLQRLDARLAFVVITAHDEPAMRARCLEAGASAYLCKPLEEGTLLTAIETACMGD